MKDVRPETPFIDGIAAALGGRRIYAWLWMLAMLWIMILPISLGIEAGDRRIGRAVGAGAMLIVLTIGVSALVLRAWLTGALYEYFFSRPASAAQPSKGISILVRYIVPMLGLGCLLSPWLWNFILE